MNPLDQLSDKAAEMAILSHFLLHPEKITESGIREEDFTSPPHIYVYRCFDRMVSEGNPIDPITVAADLVSNNELGKVGGREYIDALTRAGDRFPNIESYVETVRDFSTRRNLIATIRAAEARLLDTKSDPGEAISGMEQKISTQDVRRRSEGFKPIDHTLEEIVQDLDRYAKDGNTMTGVATGWADLDRFTSGLQKGDLFVIGARPSMGKSAFLLQMLSSVAQSGLPAVFFSVEMSAKSLLQRLISVISGVDLEKVRGVKSMAQEDWALVIESCSRIQGLPLYVDDTPGIDYVYMEHVFKKMVKKNDVAVCGIDYIQLISGPKNNNRTMEVQEVTQRMKNLARIYSVPFVALAQLSRANEKREDKRPIMSDLRDSGAIEQIADEIVFIYRDVVYNKETDKPNIADVIVSKNRNGSTGTIHFFFDALRTRFLDLSVKDYGESYG